MSLKLRFLVPNESPALLSALFEKGVRTGSDLLAQTPKGLFKLLLAGLATIHDLERLQTAVALQLAPPPVLADELLDASVLAPWRTASDPLDELLAAFERHDVFEIVGPPATGKTALAMTIVARELCNSPIAHALWIETRLAFDPERMLRVIEASASEATAVASATERVHVVHSHDIAAAYDALEAYFSRKELSHTRLVIIDGVTELLQPGLNAKHNHGNVTAATFVRYLATLARTQGFTAFAINSSVASSSNLSAFPGTNSVPALDATFAYLTAGILWLNNARSAFSTPVSLLENENLFVFELLRSNYAMSGQWKLVKLVSGVHFIVVQDLLRDSRVHGLPGSTSTVIPQSFIQAGAGGHLGPSYS